MFQIKVKNIATMLGHTTISGIANNSTFSGTLKNDDKTIIVESVHSTNMSDLDNVLLEVVDGNISNKDIGSVFFEE